MRKELKKALTHFAICLSMTIFYLIACIAIIVVIILQKDWLLFITLTCSAILFIFFVMGTKSAINNISELFEKLKEIE